MKIVPIYDYHVHSTFSGDGKSTIEENVKQAISLGLEEIGVSDHSFSHRTSGISVGDLERERAEIERLQSLYPDIKIKFGIEANLLNWEGNIDLTDADIKMLDYVILGIHKLTWGRGVKNSFSFNMTNFLSHSARHAEKITKSYARAFERYPISIVAHPNYAANCDINQLLSLCEEHNVLFELNRKHLQELGNCAGYINASKAKLVLSSDAHQSEDIAEFSRQIEFVEKFNIDKSRIVNIKIEK